MCVMGLALRNKTYYYCKRVPRRFQQYDPREKVLISLHTDSHEIALRKMGQIEQQLLAFWEALAAGHDANPQRSYAAIVQLAASQGFAYIPMSELVAANSNELAPRLKAVKLSLGLKNATLHADALLGGVDEPATLLSEAFTEYIDLTEDRRLQKSPDQKRRWHNPRIKAVRNFCSVIGDMDVKSISREDALKFRSWWIARIKDEQMSHNSANKDLCHLSHIFTTWADLKGIDLINPFAGLKLKEDNSEAKRPSFSRDWIANNLLDKTLLNKLNEEARDILLMTVNTGLRPSEITGSLLEDFCLEGPVPYFKVRAHNTNTHKRELKTPTTKRDMPLVGVSLFAAKRIVARGGIQRYQLSATNYSNTVNKWLRVNRLNESGDHSCYSLRHSFEESLLEMGVDERLRVELMGHRYGRPKYGTGGSLETKRDAIKKIAF